MSMNIPPLLCSLFGAAVLLDAGRARAAELEPVRFELASPPGCVDEAALRADVSALGGHFRDANLDDRARRFRIDVSILPTKEVSARLTVEDLAFRPHVREAHGSDCAEVSRSLALFVATALDERDEAPANDGPAPVSAAPRIWPAPAPGADATEPAPRVGAGGIAATVFASGLTSATSSEGIRIHGVARVVGTTRFGLAAAAARESWGNLGPHTLERADGTSTRAGAVVGWGAPWNDNVVGFTAEAGVEWGEHRGTTTPVVADSQPATGSYCTGSRCMSFDSTRTRDKGWSFVSPYVASQLVFQVPLKKLPIRPIAALGGLWVPIAAGGASFATTIEGGLAWQAW
jgi:hypothetical protein